MRQLIALVLLVAASAAAQPNPGDWVLSDYVNNNELVCVDPSTGQLTTLVTARNDGYLNAVAMAWNNEHLVTLLTGKGTDALLRVSPQGRVQTQVVFPTGGRPNGIAFDEAGNYLVSSADANLYRVRGFSIVGTVKTGLLSTINAVTIDLDTGDPVVGTFFGPGHLLRVDAGTTAISTIATGFAYVTGIAQVPQTGNFIVTTTQGPQIRIVTRQGQPVKQLPFYVASGVKVDSRTGGFIVCGWRQITSYDAQGNALTTYSFPGYNFSGVEIYASRPVTGSGSARPGTIYWIQVRFPQAPAQVYAVALSFAVRPGIAFDGGRTLNLANDELYRATVLGLAGFTRNFLGTLDGLGRDFARIDIPVGVPVGTRVFASAAACGRQPGYILGNTVGVTVQR